MDARRTLEVVICYGDLLELLPLGPEVFDNLGQGVIGGTDELIDEPGLVCLAIGDVVEAIFGFEAVGHQVDLSDRRVTGSLES